MIFTLEADFQLEAADLDDAFLKLAEHFTAMAEGRDSSLILRGDVRLYGEKPNQPQ